MSNINNNYTPDKLDAATLKLSGRHLIEASAGTGKTYNITRLYIRLLLEKNLTVQQILVMTFTKAATEELRGRIDKELRNALLNWGSLGENDPFFKVMEQRFDKAYAVQKLKPALLELDEAAIFTIHGFCSRALSSQAFASGISLELSMESDSSELLLESIRDWLRQIAQNKKSFAILKEKNWHIPEQFLSTFYRALNTSSDIEFIEEVTLSNSFVNDFQHKKESFLELLKDSETQIFVQFIDVHTDSENLTKAWPLLLQWFADNKNIKACSRAEGDFLKKGRLTKKAYAEIKQLLNPVYDFKQNYNKAVKIYLKELQQYQDALRSKLIVQGIYTIREKFAQQKEQQAVMDFDDLITYLSRRVQMDEGRDLVNILRQQYPVALVDEFQDTDPNQYAILDRLYSKSYEQSALFMIGDPKQAIYSFRGGDIFTYLSAREGADYHWYMDTNWRSVEQVVTGYNRLFLGESLEHESSHETFGYGITYEKINATNKAAAAKYNFSDPDEQFSAINYCYLTQRIESDGKKSSTATDDLKQRLSHWCVKEISRLLSEVKFISNDKDEIAELIQEKDIAILVRTGAEAQIMRDALSYYHFPSVYLSDKENIFKSRQAEELLRVLKGILECENNILLTTALSTYLMAGNAQKLSQYHEQDAEDAWEQQRERALQLRDIWLKKGCMTMLMKLIADDYQPEPSQHERSLTNMIHLAELLQQASRQYKHPRQLLKWFGDQCQADNTLDEAQLRLESDANLIRIVTQHGSKGLEYPIVFIPFASAYKNPVRFGNTLHEYFEYHDPQSYAARCQVGQSDEAIELAAAEGHAETIRLLYVAITRASYRSYIGIAPFTNSEKSPLGLTLKLSNDDSYSVEDSCSVDDSLSVEDSHSVEDSYSVEDSWIESLEQLVNSSEQSSSLIMIDDKDVQVSSRQVSEKIDEPLRVSKLNHAIDDQWSLNSFSSLMRESYTIRQEEKDRSDDDSYEAVNKEVGSTAKRQPLRFSIRKGADTGNLLHDIMEHTNFGASTEWPIATPLRRFGGLEEAKQTELTVWLQDCLDSSLPAIEPETAPFKLSDLAWSQTLRETEFYFPMKAMKLESLGACLQIHRADTQRVNLPETKQLEGMMRGFIDLIFERNGRFYVADYKSTYLGEQFENYDWHALKSNNQQHYYDLQYLIYSLALHRYLKTRIDDYDPELHFGGVYYLYLRGMRAENAHPYGIFHTRIELTLLELLDKVFQGKYIQEATI